MNKTLIAAIAALVCDAMLCAAFAFELPKPQKAKSIEPNGNADGKVLAARRAKVAACALLNEGIPLLEAGQYDVAIELFSQAIAGYPKLSKAYRCRGLAFYKKDELEKALADLNGAIEFDPSELTNYDVRGCVFVSKGDYARAVADFDVLVECAPESALAFWRRGWCRLRLGELSKALSDLNEAIRLDPQLAQAYRDRGQVFEAKGEYAHATADFTRVIELGDADAWPFLSRACSYYCHGDYDKCIADCNEAIRLDPKNSCGYLNRGAALLMKESFSESIIDSTKAIELASVAIASPYINRALALAANGKHEGAIQDLEAALDLAPASHNANVLLACQFAACEDERWRDAGRAMKIAMQACKSDGWKNARSLDVLGMAYAEASEFDEAIEYTDKALSIAATFRDSSMLQQRLRERIEHYRSGKAYRAKLPNWVKEHFVHNDFRTFFTPETLTNALNTPRR